MSSPLVLTQQAEQGIAILTLNRPDKRNALSKALMEACCDQLDVLAQDKNQRVLILRGEGPVFCAGLDLEEARVTENVEQTARLVVRLLRSVYQLPLITVAVVQGAAVAGGAGLMSACDFVIAANDARIGYPEVKRGLVAASVMTLLRRQIRERDARELLLLGEMITAGRALEMGLINRVVPGDKLMETALAIARAALQAAPSALAQTKKLLDELSPCSLDQELDQALLYHLSARNSAEAREGMAAFLEKRPPRWPS